jgi:hypothetical protein
LLLLIFGSQLGGRFGGGVVFFFLFFFLFDYFRNGIDA